MLISVTIKDAGDVMNSIFGNLDKFRFVAFMIIESFAVAKKEHSESLKNRSVGQKQIDDD